MSNILGFIVIQFFAATRYSDSPEQSEGIIGHLIRETGN
jgi:hypothetical protein